VTLGDASCGLVPEARSELGVVEGAGLLGSTGYFFGRHDDFGTTISLDEKSDAGRRWTPSRQKMRRAHCFAVQSRSERESS
jgi:hypothetical protein